MAKLPPLGPVRMATSSIDDEYEDLVTVPEGYREKPPADLNIVEMEEIQRRYIEAATQYVNETTTGVTEEERDKLAQEYLEEIGADPNSPNRAAEAWAAENRAEDNPESVFFRSIWPKESVFPVPGSYSQTATYKERLEDRMFYNTKNALQEAEGLTEDEAIARSFQATPSRQESSGQDLVDRVTRAENLTLRPGVFQSYGEIANESALGSGVRSVASWASSYVNPFHVGAETVAEKYYGQSRGQRWWKNRDEYFNARVVYAGHPAEKAHKDVAHPDTGQFRPWYETVEIRAHLGTASDEELETYNQNLERHNNIQSGRASFIDVLGQYIQQRDAFLKETKSAKEVGSIESAWIAQPSDWVSEWKKRSGVKLSVEEIRKDWDDIDTYPTNSQVAERVKAAIDVWKVRQEMLDSGRDGEEITKRLDRIVQSIPSDLWPDKRLRIVHANELGESSFMTRAGHVQASWVGDTAMFANPIFKALNPHDPEIDFSGLDTAFKRSAQTVVQTGSTVAQGFVRVGDWIGIDVPGSNFGQTNTALWGSEVAENFKTFFDNEELISDDPSVRKSELTRMFLSLSRRDIHVNEYLLNVPSFSEFKNEFLEVQDHPVQPPQAISIYLENPNVRYLHPAMYRIVQGAKERAKEENLELEEYVYSDDGWQTIESQLNRQKLFTLPGKIATGVFKKMGGYEGIRKDIERQTAAREAMYGPENRQVGAFLSQTLGNAMTDSRYLEDGTTITVNETGAGTFLRVGGEFAAGPISEIAMDVLFDPIMAIGDQFGAWDWDGRANDRGSVNDFWVGMDDTAVAGFTGRLQEAAAGLGYDKNTELHRAFTAIGLGFDLLTPMEEMGLATMARPFVGTQRLRKIYEDMPGTRLSSDTLRASYLPNGFYGIGSLWKKVAPVEDIADYQKAVDTAKTGAAERRADTVARQGRRDLREVVFGDPELNLAKKRLKDATSRQRGFMSWRRAMPGMGPAPLTKKFGGMHDLTSMMAGELFNKNLLQGRNPLEGFGEKFRSNVFEVMRRGGIAAEDVNRVLKDSSKMRTAKFLSEAAERLDSVDDYTKGIRESASYSRLRDELEAANERNPLNYKSLEGIDVVDSLMAMIETHAVGLARIRGIEEGSKAIETYMERLLQDVESGRAVEPPSMAIASRAGEVDSAKQALVDSIPADELRTVDVDLSDEAQLNALSDAAQFEIVTAVGDKAALRSMGMDMLVTLIGRVSSKSDVGADLLGEISHRLAKEFADMPATAQSKFDDFVELLSRAEDNMLAQFSDEAALDSVRKLFDNVLEDVSERVRRARETLDDAGEAKVSAAQANAGRAQIAQSIRALAEKGFLEAGQAAVLEALVMSLPERVLRDIRLNDQIAGIAQGASARTTELLTEGGAVDRLISSVDFFGYADEIGTMKAAESSVFIGANLDEIFEAIRYKRDDNQGFRSVAIRFLSDRKNPKTGKTYTSRELSERYVDAETWMKRQEGEVFSAEKTEQLVSQFEHALDSYKRGSDRVGPRTYQFLHELGHGVAMSFLADSEIAILSKAFRDELDDFGLFRDTPYTRNFQTMTDIQFNEWFAENFAEFVITHRLPNVVATQRGAGDLLRIFNNLIERMSNWFSSWYRRDPRARTDFHPALSTLVDRLFDDKAAGMASRREVALRRATGFQVRMADEGVFSALSRQRAGLDGQYIPDLDEVEVAQDLLKMEEELPPAELRMAEAPPTDVVQAEKSNVPTDVGLGELTLGEANAAMRQAKTGTELAEFIAENADNPVHQRIAERIKPHLGDTEVHVIDGSEDIPKAVYDMEKKGTLPNEVAYKLALISAHESRLRVVTRGLNWSPAGDAFNDVFLRGNEAFSGTTAETALHELVHAATVRRLSDGNLPANKGTKLQSASNELYALVNDVIKIAKKAQKEKILDAATEKVLISATGDVKEFVAYGLTNKTFQDYLMTIKVEDKSMWNVFVEKIADLLGVAKKDHNALTELIRVTDELLDAPLEELASRPLTEFISLMEEPVKRAAKAPESIEMQILIERAAKAEESLSKATAVGTKRLYERRLNTVNRRIEALRESQGVAEPTTKVAAGPTGSSDLLDIDGAVDRLGPDIRQVLNERDALDSGHFSEELAAEFDLSSEKIGGTPHTIVDSEIDSGLKQRVFNSEITSYQAEILKERLGRASPLEDISTDTKFTVERIVETPEGTKVERSEVSAPVYPMLKATGFGGEQGMKVLIPGGKEGVFSFADVQYLARRPIEMITNEAAGKWWSDVGEGLFGDADTLGNFDEIIEQYKEAYTVMVEEMYDKLHSGYGLEAKRPNVKDFFSGNRFINNDVRADWAQQMEVHLMDVASQYVFAFLSMQTNLLDNQMFAAVARPRNMRDLADMVGRGRTATANKGSSLTRNEANHILGFSVTIGTGVLEGRFGKKQILLDVETEVLPIIEIRDWTKPNGPLIRVQSVDIAPLNADKIAGKARKALGRYVKFKRQVEKIESRIPTIKDAAKRRRAKTQLKQAIKEMEAADMAHRAVLNSVSSTDVVALTGDLVLSSPADTVKLLDMYDMMYEDFVRVQRGDLKQSFFERYPDETWDAFSDRVSSMVPGMATKISAFGIYWQNPIAATISAIDIHQIGIVGKKLLKEERWQNKARGWYDDWRTIKSKASIKHLEEVAESQLIKESTTNRAPGFRSIKNRAKQILNEQRKFRDSVSFEQFLEADKSNPGYTFWRDQLRTEITTPQRLQVHPVGVPEYRKAFPTKNIDSKKVSQVMADVKANTKLTPKQRVDRVGKLEDAIKAHEHIESAEKMFGSDHPIVDRFIKDLSREKDGTKYVEIMSPDYREVLESMARDVQERDVLGNVATRSHVIWDEWRGYLDPHVIVQPGSAMLPAVRPAALKSIIKSLESTFPEIKDPRVQADLTSRHSRLVSGLFGAGFRDLHSSLKEGSFGGTAPFEGRPLPTEMSKGALYMREGGPPSTPLNILISAGRDLSDLFNKGDASVLFKENSNALMYLMVEEFPEMMEVFTNKFDSIVGENGVTTLTGRGRAEVNDAFVDFWHSRHVDDPQVDMAFQGIKDKLSVFWRRIRHRADRTNPAVRRYFDEWLGVVNDAKKEAMFDVSNSAEFKSIPRVPLKESVLETEQVAKRGRAKEATRIDLDEGRIRYALELGDDVTEVDTFKTMQKAVEYVSREMSRQKYTNNWVSFSTRSIVPARMLARHLEEVQLRTYSVFGDPHALKKQMEKIPKERIKRDRFGDDVIDVSSMDNLPEREVATEMLPDGREVPTEIIVFNLTELQQGRLKSLLLELYADPRTKVPVRRVLGEYLGPNADLSVLPEAHYQFIVQEMIRDHVVGVGTGLTKEMNRVPKSLGYAAVQGVLGSAPFRAAGGDALVRMLKKQFKTRKPLAHIRRSKTGKETSADTEVLSPVVKELFMRRSRQIDDIPNWIRRVQKSLKDGRMASGVWETLEGLKEVLEQPISNQAYRILDNVEVYFDSQKGIRFDDLISRIDEIQIAFADNRLMLNAERKAFDLLREVDRIKKTQPERTVVRNGRVEIKDPVMREGIAEAYLVISEGVSRRLHMADNAVETIIVGMAGSPEAAQKIFNRRADVFTDRGQAISLYNLFYRGDWSEVLKRFAEQGYATGTATKYPGRYNLGHAMLETIIRLRAQSIFKGLLNDMTDMGMSVKIKDLAPPTIRSITEKRAFANRVKLYLNEEIKFGGVQHLVDEDGRIIHEGLQSRFEGPRFLPEAGGKVQGAGPGSSLLSKEARARLADLEGYRKTQATLGDVVTKVVVDDLEAYTVAQDLIEKWGMKYGSNIENWEIARFPDGSEALTPKLFSEEISDAVDRVAGTASARAGKSRLKLDGLMASDSRLVPEEGTPSLKGRAQRFKRDYLQSADVMNYMMNTLGWSYRMTKMGLTSGIFMVNLPYYVANAFGAQLQVYQKVGMRGYFSSMSHPVISLEVAASLWGRTPTMRFLEVKPVVTPDGSVWSREALTRACHEHGLSGSFLSMETARSIAVDLKKNEPSFWEKMSGETEYEKLPYKEVDYPGFAGIDLPGPVTALRFYHEQLINFATFIDNYHRVALFTEGVGRGLSPADAAKSARSALFDYSDLTAAEKKYMRQIFIFYSFQRKNLDLFWDTFLTNPHRIMGQFRLVRGVNQVYLDGDETLIESDYSVGRLGLMFVKNSANRLVQKNRYNAPMLPAMEAIKGQLDFFSFVGSFIPTDDVILRQKRMKNQLKFMSRLNPWIQAPMAMTIQKSFFKGTRMRPERIPTFWAQHDILTNGGMLLRGVGGRVRPIKSWEEQEFPGQTHVYEAAEKMNWYLLQNIWHGPVPVMPMREDTPGTSWMGDVGEVIDYSPIGLALRSQPIKGFKEGTLGVAPAGRMIDSLNRFGRGGMIIPQMLDADLKYYKHLVASGKRGRLVDDSRLGEGEDFDQAMNALGFQIDPETGDIDFQQGPEGEPIRGAGPRIGVDEGWKSVLFGVQQMPTEDAAILMHYYRTQRALTGAVGEVEAKTRDRPLDISDRYEPEGSD